jgi:glycosyltransferase involved in cell wall biosynthesis
MTRSVLQVNASDTGGGAEVVSLSLHCAYRARGLETTLAVGRARGGEEGVVQIGDAHTRRARALRDPRVLWDVLRGREDFRFPASRGVLELPPRPPDVLHLHNLHGDYFDLRALPDLSRRQPTVVTMHDEWLYTGHCAYTIDSERWLHGCGSCPHLDSYPALRVDGTAANWRRKAELHARSRLHVVTPSQWLLDRAQRSMLAPAIVSARVIPNGIDLDLFAPGDRAEARARLGLPHTARVLVFAAQGARTNPFKDFETLRGALKELGGVVVAVALGEAGEDEHLGSVRLCSEPFADRERVATHLRAADVYVHATRADNHPLAVLEALACGVPVVSAGVGGISEQVTAETGVLVPPGDAPALARGIESLLADDERRARMGAAATADARSRFSLDQQVDTYLDLYAELC